MKSKIINWTFIGLLAVLTACGGSDDSETTGTGTNSGGSSNNDDTTPDPVADVGNDSIGLGSIVNGTYQDQVATVGIGAGTLAANGSTTVEVTVVNRDDNNSEYLGLSNVFFVSACSQVGLAEFSPAEVQASGSAQTTYTDKGCGKENGADDSVVVFVGTKDDQDNIIAEATARATISIAAAQVGAIQYVKADPSLIAINGFGTENTPSLTQVEFKLVDESGNPMPERLVSFALDHQIGSAVLSLSEAVTNQEGAVSVILNAGNVPGTVRVKASITVDDGGTDRTITTMSAPIVMATSLGDQNSFTLGATSFNPRAWDFNGTEVDIVARLGDHNQNPVLDGTRIYFTATGGVIEPSCETLGGVCSVKWYSANPRPVDGYVKILAHSRGQGNYQDANSNGLFDVGERFESFGEAWVDANGNGTYDKDAVYQSDLDIDNDGSNEFSWDNTKINFYEEFVDSNFNGVHDINGGAVYQGVNCSQAAIDANHCASLIDVYADITLQMSSGTDYYIEGPFAWDAGLSRFDTSSTITCVDGRTTLHTVAWRISDSKARRNALPNGTKIGTETDNVAIKAQSGIGDITSIAPPATLPAYEAATGLSGAELKYAYLADRGHLIWVNLTAPDSFTSTTGYGTIAPKVDLLNGQTVSGPILEVDLMGARCPAP